MDGGSLFGSDLWKPALDKYAEATGLSVELFDAEERVVLSSAHPTPLVALLHEYGFDPGLFVECARRCLRQTHPRPAVAVDESHGLTVVGTSLVLEGAIVGAAVAGYAFARFSQVPSVQRWAKSAGVPFSRLWDIARRQPPVPERRLRLHGELLQVLGDALLRENYRTRQYEDTVVQLRGAAAAKDEFLAVLSHELRTPLTPILGWAGILQRNPDATLVRQAADVIARNVLLQNRMIEELLDLNLIARGTVKLDLKKLELSALLRTALEGSARDIEKKGITLELVDAGERLFVDGDAGRLNQVFRNILSNAVKFTPAGGGIRVRLGRVAGSARIVVSDTGVGIAPQFLPHAFDIFRQQEQGTHREHEGLGIGLALVKQLTDLHKGTVRIASAGAGRGTEVTLHLPLATETADTDAAAPAGPELSASALAGLSLLVVENSEDTRETLRVLLEQVGAYVSVARDGREALHLMQDADPDLVLCDLWMARMDGFEFIRELHGRASSAQPPVIAVSGLASDADHERTREAGFEGHITKPFALATLVAAIREALKRRGGSGEQARI